MTTLDTVKTEVQVWDKSRPRSQQIQTGASGMFECRAANLLRLTETPESDPRLAWEAVVGTAVHAMLEAASPPEVLTEQRVTYRGVPCTIDRYDPAARTLVDYKTKNAAGDIAKVRRYGPDRGEVAQVQIGAAALIEAGHPVDTVELLYLPRAGDLDSAWSWSAPFDRAQADAAADWSAEQDDRAEWALSTGVPAQAHLEGLRDEPERFCRSYCPWVTLCRGPERELDVADDPALAEAAGVYAAGKAMEAEGKSLAESARRDLLGVSAVCGGWQVRTVGGNNRLVEEVDLDRVLADYRQWIGDPPVRVVESTTAVQLRVSAVKQ